MYRSSFGIVAPPFQLTPDPSFYFDSRGHHRALVELRRGVDEVSSFVVVSGDIGAGKTTLVRTVVAGLDPAQVAVANVVSTQLDADELLEAVAIGFGIPRGAAAAEDVDTALRRFFADLDAQSRRALLIVDEAQHLSYAALERLRALTTHRSPNRLPVQVWLVGQSELRTMLEAPDAVALRRAIGVWCRLGPIDPEETGPYIEHRLRRVGWNGTPRFESGAFEEIFRSTHGIPRRINLLCNRLLMSRFLAQATSIDPATVSQSAQELHAEIGEAPTETPLVPPVPLLRAVPAKVPTLSLSQVAHPTVVHLPPRVHAPAPAAERSPYLCVVAGYSDHVKAAGLLRALEAVGESAPVTLLRIHDNEALAYCAALYRGLKALDHLVTLDVVESRDDSQNEALTTAFQAAVERIAPRAVVVFDGSRAALACSLVAVEKRIPLVHVGAGLRVRQADPLAPSTRKSVDHLADVLFTPDAEATATLVEEGIPTERIHCTGTLAMDAVRFALGLVLTKQLQRKGRPARYFDDPRGYALVVVGDPANVEDRGALTEVMALLFEVSRTLPLIWPMRTRLYTQLKQFRLETYILENRVRRVAAQRYVDYVRLLHDARCVLTDSWTVQEEAAGLGVPCLVIGAFPERPIQGAANVPVGHSRTLALSALWEIVLGGESLAREVPLWDGKCGARVAGFLAPWKTRRA